MDFGFVLPGGTADEQAEAAEEAGWDGIFVWEGAYGVDAWCLLAAMAGATRTIRLGTMLTPLPWRRPWKLASQVATVDQLSGGRVILSVGLGSADSGIGDRNDATSRADRADRLDEGIDILETLWSGGLSHHGRRYDVDIAPGHVLDLRPAQTPRVPIWVVGAWPRPKSMARVLRCDGVLPVAYDGTKARALTPDDVKAIRAWLVERGERPINIVVEGVTPSEAQAAADIIGPWADAGATWWIDARWELPHHGEDRHAEVMQGLTAGPPVR
ncbi:MAG: LLM class flavin-dependent oxidoreductase [Mycobacteriales bacterium]